MEDVQMALNVAITKAAIDFQANMSANIINVTLDKSAEVKAAGLAAEGIGQNINIEV